MGNCGNGHLVGCISVASFAIPEKYTYGENFDLGTERAKLQLRLEGFNIFNTPSFSNPAAVFGTATFGSITSTLFPNRQIQLTGKIIF